jgi:hypothetical protein
MIEKYLTTEEVAEVCRTAPSTVRYWRFAGKGPKCRQVGRRILYAESDVARWLSGDDDQSTKAAV